MRGVGGARSTGTRMAAAAPSADRRALDQAYSDLVCLIDAFAHKSDAPLAPACCSPASIATDGGKQHVRTFAHKSDAPLAPACCSPASIATDGGKQHARDEALAVLDLSTLAFHLDMGDDDGAECAMTPRKSTTARSDSWCLERNRPWSPSDSHFSSSSTAYLVSPGWSDPYRGHDFSAPKTTGCSTNAMDFDPRLDPDYQCCFDLRDLTHSSLRSLEPGMQKFRAGSTPFNAGFSGPTPCH